MATSGKPPHFPQQPVARQNDDGSIELECFLEAAPAPDIRWFYEQKEIMDGGRFKMDLKQKGDDAYSAVLLIKVFTTLLLFFFQSVRFSN
ncbi:unnamed protein product [Soboliphyme baturini]|uniref:Ig-like domain-containing protein n=1 Tax=Soboliphyme baturini TaxID=241478 RepID=A0A183IK65_9BILA|nr:unnamed protein product [Soboliphyme baturini]